MGGVSAELKLPAGRLVDGEPSQPLGQLAGRTGQRSTATWWGFTAGTLDHAVADWIIRDRRHGIHGQGEPCARRKRLAELVLAAKAE